MLLSEAFERWRNAQDRWSTTARRYGQSIIRLERLGLRTVEDATRARVSELQAHMLRTGWTTESVRAEMNGLRAVLAHLDDLEMLPPGQLAAVRKAALKRSEVRRRRARFLSAEEFETLAAAAAEEMPRLELPIRVAVLLGARVGELARLRAEDFHEGSVSIETLPEFGEAGSCKTGPRVVPVCRELRDLLETRLPQSGWLFPSEECPRKDQLSRPFMSRSTLELKLRQLRRRMELADDITWTILRHTRASWWLQGGASIYKVADWLGHSVSTCERHYGSLVDGYDEECEKRPRASRPVALPTRSAPPARPSPTAAREIRNARRDARLAAGEYLGGEAPLGYGVGASGLEVVEEDAATVRLAFARYVETGSLAEVVRTLDERGIRPRRGGPWRRETVSRILRNKTYVGLVWYRGVEARGKHEPLVERATFDRVQALLESGRALWPHPTKSASTTGRGEDGECVEEGLLEHRQEIVRAPSGRTGG